jgi:tetratricopeptide (TPR) repeat protein
MEAYEALIKEAITNDPNNKDLLFNLGLISSQSGNFKDARMYYEKVLTIDPQYIKALKDMSALILKEEDEIVKQMNSLGNSAADDKKYDELKAKRVSIYKEAIPYLESVLKIDDTDIDYARTLAGIYSAVGDSEKAKALKAKFGL